MYLLAIASAGVSVGILPKLLLLAAAAVVAITLLAKLKIPAVPAMLLAGALIGPHGFRLVRGGEDLQAISEIGVALLLFSIGLEFTRERLHQLGRRLLLAGLLQVSLAFTLTFVVALALGASLRLAIFYALILCLSSTAVVLRSLIDRQEIDAPHGRLVLTTLIIQDIIAVVLLVAVQLLAPGTGADAGGQIARILLISLVFGVLVVVARSFLIGPLMRQIDALRSREAYILTVLVLGLGTAALSGWLGLNPALGAFLAGTMLAGTEFSHRTITEVIPFREVFISLFFLSMGMLFNAAYFSSHLLEVGGLVIAIIFGKGIVSMLAVLFLRFPVRIALLFGFGLAQFGEFGYLLMVEGERLGVGEMNAPLLSGSVLATLLCAGLITMFLTPLIMNLAPHITAGERLLRPLTRLLGTRGMDDPLPADLEKSDHILIGGYGPAAMQVTRYLKAEGIPYLIIEMSAENVREAQARAEPIYYGDATSTEALSHARIGQARAVILFIKDRSGIERSIQACRQLTATTPVIARAQFSSQVETLLKLGATTVIVDELAMAELLVEHLRDYCGTRSNTT